MTVEFTFSLFTATTGPKIAGTARLPLEIEPEDFGCWPLARDTATSAAWPSPSQAVFQTTGLAGVEGLVDRRQQAGAFLIRQLLRRDQKRAEWRDFVRGFTCANDVTARDLQKKDVQFTRGKSFDTFCPLGPCIEDDLDVSALKLQTRVNGEVKQDGNTSQMVFPCDFLIEFIASVMTILPGDGILTGTPAGVGPLNAGDTVEVEIEGIGTLRNVVA